MATCYNLYSLNMVTSDFFFPHSVVTVSHFFPKKPLNLLLPGPSFLVAHCGISPKTNHWYKAALFFSVQFLFLWEKTRQISKENFEILCHTLTQIFLIRLGGPFFFSILWCRQTGDHPQEDLAKFGYIPNMKVENFKKPSYILAAYWKLM